MIYQVLPEVLNILDNIQMLRGMMEDPAAREGLTEQECKDQMQACRDTLESLNLSLSDIVEEVAKDIRNSERHVDAYKREMQLLKRSCEAKEKRVEDEKSFIRMIMEKNGENKLDAGMFDVRLRKNGGKLGIEYHCETEDLPEQFRIAETVWKKNDKAIRQYLDTVGPSDLFEYKERGKSVVIQ